MFRGTRQSQKVKILKISGGTGGSGGVGGANGGSGGLGEGPKVKIVGRTVTNISKNYFTDPTLNSDFRTIPLGDIDLQREIQLDDESGIGDGAEDEWRRDIKKYMAIRHPNIVQLYGTASCGNIHAAVFHDDLIPIRQFLDLYRRSHFSTVYIYAYIDNEFRAVSAYFSAIFKRNLLDNCTFLIRHSTGRFCVDLVPGDRPIHYIWKNMEATVIDSLTLDQYHYLCNRVFAVPEFVPISSRSDDLGEIAWLPNAARLAGPSWYGFDDMDAWSYELMPNGWSCLKSNDIVDTTASVGFSASDEDDDFWLSQANHIFTTHHILSDFHHYVVVEQVHFDLTISEGNIPHGFLFFCPPEDFRTGPTSLKWPDCPVYWSLDPTGAERLAPEEAISLGFPSFLLSIRIYGRSWDASVYAGLRQFHTAKGFDPDSQDVARHLGHKLYRLPGPFAHIDEYSDESDDRDETDQNSGDEEFDNELDSTLLDDEEYPDNTCDGVGTSLYSTDEFDRPFELPDLATVPTFRARQKMLVAYILREIADSARTDPDLGATFGHRDVDEIQISSRFLMIPVLDLPIASPDADAEKMPVSTALKFILAMQLFFMLFLALLGFLLAM
ncbi:hypothetical protein MSAN_00306100 [Mycena sanguinolenta]|uniref:Uncharacterized protein n=1 Tax=Mycena sanguinolenta TaxID=230812 RepID=A0A8H7DJ63_9AGAR|nr:hypothetical protein MSAN_00306100 [Mycena sanguinolenta]